MEFLYEFGLFTAKALVIAFAVGGVAIAIISMAINSRRSGSGLDVDRINDNYREMKRYLQREILDKKERKAIAKAEKKKAKLEKNDPQEKKHIFILDFDGDIRASAVTDLREEISAIISVAKPGDEAMVKVESGGGLVTSYGLAASQLERLKKANIRLTVCVDKVAASGGYMMACVADHICAAPFAVLGSIGVVAQVPNFAKVLKKHDIDFREITAGEFKRTVSTFGDITESGIEKFKEQIEETHVLFKNFVSRHRPHLDIQKVATGEHWYGTTALELGLCDEITTSDDYLLSRVESAELIAVNHFGRKKLSERISESMSATLRGLVVRLWSDVEASRFGT